MNANLKAKELIAKHFEIIAKASNYKGLHKEGEGKFYAIENVAIKCAIISAIETIEALQITGDITWKFWSQVKDELNKML